MPAYSLLRPAIALTLAASAAILAAQTPASEKPAASAEPLIVDVHPSPYRSVTADRNNISHQRFEMRDATMLDMIAFAYEREDQAIVGGPSWIEFDRFDIAAKIASLEPPSFNAAPAPAGAPPANPYKAILPVVQSVLADRFHLVYHTEDRPLPGYIMTVAKDGLKLTDAKNPAAPNACQVQQDKAAPGHVTLACTSETLAQFLSAYGRAYPHPVVDHTGLTKPYDFSLKLDFTQIRSQQDYVRYLTDAFNRQLGLVVSPGVVPQPAIVIDSVDRTPTPNAPDIAKQIPAMPDLEFEVATIHLSAPNDPQWNIRPTGTEITFYGFTEQDLIVRAWRLPTGAMLANAPPWINEVKYTVLVKLPPDLDGRAIYQNLDQMDQMLQKLVVDRFHLQYHWGEQKQDGYVLLASTPKMKKANPASRSFCKEGPPDGDKDLRTVPEAAFDREFHCQNVTMAQFADRIQPFTNSEVKNRVPDKTGLAGAYDFTLYYTTVRTLRTQTTAAADAAKQAGDAAPAPAPGIGVEDAFRKQLGLRLEKQPLQLPAFVIDHIDQTPTEN